MVVVAGQHAFGALRHRQVGGHPGRRAARDRAHIAPGARREFGRDAARQHAIGRMQQHGLRRGQLGDQRLEAIGHREARARNVLFLEGRAPVDVKHAGGPGQQLRLGLLRRHQRRRCMQRQHAHRLGADFQRGQGRRRVQKDFVAAQLGQPGARGQRAHAVPVGQHDARAARRRVFVRGLHQLAARRPAPARQMAGCVFLLGAHVEAVKRALLRLAFETRELRRIYALHARALRHVGRAFARLGQRCGGGFGKARAAAMGQRAAGEQPVHGAVAQRGHAVGNAGVDQRLRADDAARAPGAVHHHKSLGVGSDLAYAIHQLGARQAQRERQAERRELLGRAAVDDNDVVAALHALLQLVGSDPGRVLLVFDDFAKRLAGHVGAAEDFKARGGPAVGAAFEHRHIAPAQARELGRGLVRQRLVGIDQHDARCAARHQAVYHQLQPPQRRRRREQDVAVGKHAGLAHVKHGDLLAVKQRGLERLGRDHGVANRLGRAESAEAAAFKAFKHHAAGQAIDRQAVEMQVQAGLVADQLYGVHVGGRQHDGHARGHIDAALGGEGVARRVRRLVAAEKHIALVARHAGNDGPGRVIVRRLRLARQAGRQVQRVAAGRVLAQAIDLGRVLRRHREMFRGKQFALRAQALEQRGDGAQLLGRGTLRVGHQPARLGNEVRHGSGAAAGDIAAAEVEGNMGLCHGMCLRGFQPRYAPAAACPTKKTADR